MIKIKKTAVILRPFLLTSLLVFFTLLLASCAARSVDITVYVMLDDVRVVDYMIKEYNRSQRRTYVEYKIITPDHLEVVLTNKMQRANMFILIAPYQIPKRGKDSFFLDIVSTHGSDWGVSRLHALAQKVVEETNSYCAPLYFYAIKDGLTQAACVSLVSLGYASQNFAAMSDLLQFLSNPYINARALMFQNIPVYEDSGASALSVDNKKRVDETALPMDYLTEDLLPNEYLKLSP